jgi:ribosomal protein L11 methylase PrmA
LELRVATPEDLIPEEFDVIVANLDRKTLLRYFPVFGKHLRPRGTLFTSGLQSEDYPEILEALAGAGWAVRGRRDRDEWMALELQIGT